MASVTGLSFRRLRFREDLHAREAASEKDCFILASLPKRIHSRQTVTRRAVCLALTILRPLASSLVSLVLGCLF
jgi:hypothetical protein